MLPWIMERGEVAVSEVAERFHLTEAEVVADLERVAMCGVPPYGPDDLVDLFVDDGHVVAGPARFFNRPLRLTAPEAFALLASARTAQQLPGADPAGALARALDKLAAVVGHDAVTVDLSRPVALDEINAAVEERRQLRIEYWSAASDEASERVVDPIAVFADRGNWYVVADDHRSGEERTFRVDRIVAVAPTGVVRDGRPPSAAGVPRRGVVRRSGRAATRHLATAARRGVDHGAVPDRCGGAAGRRRLRGGAAGDE